VATRAHPPGLRLRGRFARKIKDSFGCPFAWRNASWRVLRRRFMEPR